MRIKYDILTHIRWRGRAHYPPGVAGLHLEIFDFYHWMIATPEEYIMRYDVVKRVESVIKHEFPGVRVEVFGSFQTGLYLPTSDIDMVVFGEFSPGEGAKAYYQLQKALVDTGVAEALSIKVIDRAAVPIVKVWRKIC